MKKEFKGKLNLNKEKISRIESAKIKGGTGTLQGCTVFTCDVCGDPNFTRDGASACKCK